jgi:hypothetical protein
MKIVYRREVGEEAVRREEGRIVECGEEPVTIEIE